MKSLKRNIYVQARIRTKAIFNYWLQCSAHSRVRFSNFTHDFLYDHLAITVQKENELILRVFAISREILFIVQTLNFDRLRSSRIIFLCKVFGQSKIGWRKLAASKIHNVWETEEKVVSPLSIFKVIFLLFNWTLFFSGIDLGQTEVAEDDVLRIKI